MATNFFTFRPINNITPFTYRDGWTYLELLEALRTYVRETLVTEVNQVIDEVNDALGQVETDYQEALNNLVASFDDKISELETAFDGKISTVQGAYDDFVALINSLVAAINNRIGSPEVLHINLTSDTTLTLPEGTPTNHVVRVRVVQGGVGGFILTMPPNVSGDFRLNRAPGSVTLLTLYPNGSGSFSVENDDSGTITGRAAGGEILVYGHSYTIVPNSHVTNQNSDEWPLRLGRLTGCKGVSKGNSGWLMYQISSRIGHGFGDPNSKWFPGKASAVVIEGTTNDLLRPRTTGRENSYRNALRHALARLESGNIMDAESAKLSGCTVYPLGEFGEGSWVGLLTSDSSVTWHGVSAPLGYVHAAVVANSTAVMSNVIGFKVDGADTGVRWNPYGQTEDPNDSAAEIRTYASVKVPVSKYGVHVVQAYVVGSTLGTSWIDALLIPTGKRPGVVVCKEPFVGTAITLPNGQANWIANIGAYNSITDSVCAEFPNVKVVDLNVGYRSEIMYNTSDSAKFHPNTLGHRFISDVLASATADSVAYSKATSASICDSNTSQRFEPSVGPDVITHTTKPSVTTQGGVAYLAGVVKRSTGQLMPGTVYKVMKLNSAFTPQEKVGIEVHNPFGDSRTLITVDVDGQVSISVSVAADYAYLSGMFWRM